MKTQKHQNGAALVVCLVLLLVLTVLGISTMSTASVELRMAANDRFFENAFQLAETGIDTVLRGMNGGIVAPPPATAANTCNPTTAPVAVPGMGGTFQNTLCFTGDIPDITGGGGSSIGKVNAFHYQNDSQGIAQGQASSFNSQGARVLGPSGS
jgi:type IV pilus assembly protein PilX